MISEIEKNKIWELRQQGLSILQISIQLKISKATVWDWCNRFDPEKIYNHSHKKRNLKEINKIIECYKNNLNLKKTSELFPKWNKMTIRNILIKENIYIGRNKEESNAERSRRKSLNVINYKKRKKQELIDYKGGKCIKCGYNKCIEALEFHHRDPSQKDFEISSNSFSFEKMKKEVDKCDLLCSNCHKETHYELKYGPID